MPNRILRDWTDSEKINKLPPQSEVFFIRLIMKADDWGRFHGNPKLLNSLLYPLRDDITNTDILNWIIDLENAGLIRCYEVCNKQYIMINKFEQRSRNLKSKFPEPNPIYNN